MIVQTSSSCNKTGSRTSKVVALTLRADKHCTNNFIVYRDFHASFTRDPQALVKKWSRNGNIRPHPILDQ